MIISGILITFSICGFAQNDELVSVKKSDLPADLVTKLDQQQKLQNIKQSLDSIKTITSVGKEIGIAINDGLAAVTDQTARFAATTPGKFTMFLIAWKVMSKDAQNITSAVLGVVIGVPFLIFVEFFMLYMYRRTTNKKRVVIEEAGKDKKYEYQDTWYTKASEDKDDNANKVAFIICWWLMLLIANVWIIAGIIF